MDLIIKPENYIVKHQKVEAEKLECDVKIKVPNSEPIYIYGGNYLIKGPDGQIYPVHKRLFEFLFEREEQ